MDPLRRALRIPGALEKHNGGSLGAWGEELIYHVLRSPGEKAVLLGESCFNPLCAFLFLCLACRQAKDVKTTLLKP